MRQSTMRLLNWSFHLIKCVLIQSKDLGGWKEVLTEKRLIRLLTPKLIVHVRGVGCTKKKAAGVTALMSALLPRTTLATRIRLNKGDRNMYIE